MKEKDEIVCKCMNVTRAEIVKAIREKGLISLDEVQEATDAGTGCGGCCDEIDLILDKENGI